MSTIRNNQTIMTDELTLFVKTTYYQQASMNLKFKDLKVYRNLDPELTFSLSLKNN